MCKVSTNLHINFTLKIINAPRCLTAGLTLMNTADEGGAGRTSARKLPGAVHP